MTAQDKIWKVIRGLGEFTVDDVAILTGINKRSVAVYLSTLHSAGYLRITGKRKGATTQSLYRLIKNTGPKTPTQRRCIYDPNKKQLIVIGKEEGK